MTSDSEQTLKKYEATGLIDSKIREHEDRAERKYVTQERFDYATQSLRLEIKNGLKEVSARLENLELSESDRRKDKKQFAWLVISSLVSPVLLAIAWILTKFGGGG